jgi:murein DD-endopeptidase MepM/ murein hydrolase activator NlpD
MDFNGCCGDSPHRRALEPLGGTPYLSERFAADLIQVDEHGVGGAGDFSRNESLFTYGEPVLAVANAKVVETVRDVKDNVPFFEPPSSAFTERTIVGNRIILRLRDGRYAAYGHLKPGSIRVRRGDRVRAGQVIAQVGNTGQSGGAHLHLQVTDGPDPIASNGLPFVLRSFRLVGHVPNIDEFLTGQANADIRRDGRTGAMHREMPLMESVVRFADR